MPSAVATRKRSDKERDKDLVQAARAGDARALNALVARYEPRVYRFSYRLTGNADDAAEVAQDTLVAMARSLNTFRGESALSTWLYSVARRFSLSRHRQRVRRLAREAPFDDGAGGPPADLRSSIPTPEEMSVTRERDEAINRALRRLTPTHREVLVLRDVEGLTAPEAAKVLGLGVRAVKSRLHRARVSLRAELAPVFGETVHEPKPGCRGMVERFSRYLEGELGQATCAELEAHLKRCRNCRHDCASLREVLRACRQAPRAKLPKALKKSLQRAVRQIRAE